MNLLKGSIFMKLFALIVAVLTYWYIHNEIENAEKNQRATDPSYKLIKLTAKSLPVKVRLETIPPDGYRILENQVSVKPDQVIVVGPEALLEEAQTAETGIVDVSESTRTVTKKIPLENVAGVHLAGQPHSVEVVVPIEKSEPESPKEAVA